MYSTVDGQLKRRKIRLIEGNEKCRHIKKSTCKGAFAAGVYLSETQNTIPPPLYTLYTCKQYTYSHREGEGGRVEPERMREGQQFTKLGRKYQPDWPVYKL
jgi:hypothetical protein